MPISWIDDGSVDNGMRRLAISHSSVWTSEDVASQQFDFLRKINDLLPEDVTYVGLLSSHGIVQADSKVARKIGLWDSARRHLSPALFRDRSAYFSIAVEVPSGIGLVGGVFTERSSFNELEPLAREMPENIFVWGRSRAALVHCFNAENSDQRVLIVEMKHKRCRISIEVLADVCRRAGAVVCVPELEIDLDDAEILIVDPLEILTSFLTDLLGPNSS